MKEASLTISNTEKINMISNFQTLLSAGIPILESVDSLLEDSKGGVRKILEALKKDLVEGKHIYVSFSRFPKVFDKVTINLIKASEEAGNLDTSLKDLKDNIRREMEFIDKIKSALTYPLVIMVVFIGVMVMILTVVIPKISTVFLQLRVELPLPTRIMIAVSNLLLNYTIFFVGAIVIFMAILGFLLMTNKRAVYRVIFALPLVSGLVKQIELTRFSRSLGLLLSSGIPISSALALTQDVVSTKDLSRTMKIAQETVMAGKRLSEGLRSSKKSIPTMMIKIIEAGEKTGRLDKSMQEVSETLDYQVSSTLKTLTVLLEPIMLVMVGVMVGGMMLAIIAPIYGLIGQVGAPQ